MRIYSIIALNASLRLRCILISQNTLKGQRKLYLDMPSKSNKNMCTRLSQYSIFMRKWLANTNLWFDNQSLYPVAGLQLERSEHKRAAQRRAAKTSITVRPFLSFPFHDTYWNVRNCCASCAPYAQNTHPLIVRVCGVVWRLCQVWSTANVDRRWI